jgi:FtsH-binding integral membrane protein
MEDAMNYPVLAFTLSFVALSLSAQIGAYLHRRRRDQEEAEHEDLGVVLAASLTLLGLIIGFSFSMAVTRYDQRKNYEAEEANAIGTEYVRAGLLPAAEAANVRRLLRSYVDQRVLFYTTPNARRLEQINTSTAQLQTDLWSAVQAPAAAQPTFMVALAVSGMNDVLNSQGYTQAAWWNRIPGAAWALMAAIAICCNLLVGYNARRAGGKMKSFLLLPLIVSIAFFLIADMDSPRGGLVLVHPHNLESVSRSLRAP